MSRIPRKAASAKSTQAASEKNAPGRASVRSRTLMAAGLVVVAVAALAFQISRFYPHNSDLLTLSDSIALEPPPPVPGSDIAEARAAILEARTRLRDATASGLPAEPGKLVEAAEAAASGGDLLSARSALLRASAGTRTPKPALGAALAGIESKLGRREEAKRLYAAILETDPADWGARIGLATTLSELGEQARAEQELARCSRAMPPQDVQGHLALAAVYDQRYNTLRASEEARAALRAAPDDPGVVVSLAGLLLKLHRFDEAQALIAKSLAAHPDVGRLHRLMAQCLSDPLNRRGSEVPWERVEDHYLRALRSDAADVKAAEGLARLYLDRGKPRQAAYVLLLALKADPRSVAIRTLFAQALGAAGQAAEAGAQKQLAQQLLLQERAVSRLSSAIRRSPMDPGPRLELASEYEKAGQYGRALEAAEAAVAVSPTAPGPRERLKALAEAIGIDVPAPPDSTELH